jgi:hypothetical protein
MTGEVRIAVLIPCYNEALTIAQVVTDFRAALPAARIYVYDNNSSDETIARAREAGAIVRTERRQGKGYVVCRMFADIEADAYVLVDGDGTYDASASAAMVALLLSEQLDMVNGTRIDTVKESYRRGHRIGNRMLTGLVRVIFGSGVADMLSGYRVFSRRFIKSFPAMSTGFEIETQFTIHALELDMPVGDIPTRYCEREPTSASKLRTYQDGLRILQTIGTLVKDERPLQFFLVSAACILLLALTLGFPVVTEFVRTHRVPRLPTAVLAAALVGVACLLAVCGLVLESVQRGRKEAKRLAYLSIPGPEEWKTEAASGPYCFPLEQISFTRPPPFAWAPATAALIATLLWLLVDRFPRFYQGDSVSYMGTGVNGWIPPDRSWLYGFVSRWIMVLTFHVGTVVILQALSLALIAILFTRAFPRTKNGRFAAVLFGFVAAADPLLVTYSRLWLSDIPAMVLFCGFVLLLMRSLTRSETHYWRGALWLLVVSTACIFVRVAYAPVMELTLGGCLVASLWRPLSRPRRYILPLFIVPLISVGILAEANSIVSLPQFRGHAYVNRMSGLYQLGVFLPAIRIEDFRDAGMPITDAEFARLNLGKYRNRERSVWSPGTQHIRAFLESKLKTTDDYDARLQALSARIVHVGFHHHPTTFALAYLRSLAIYFNAAYWHDDFPGEMGVSVPLPQWMVDYVNTHSTPRITPQIVNHITPLYSVTQPFLWFYPFLVITGLVASLVILLRPGRFTALCPPASALIAVMLSVPLYSHDIKPRYVLAAVFLSWFLLSHLLARPVDQDLSDTTSR